MAYNVEALGNGALAVLLKDDGVFPNNKRLPLLIYSDPLGESFITADAFDTLFAGNDWDVRWKNGIFGYHHYHSTAHELLGCFAGGAKVLFGGDNGYIADFTSGTAVLIPAGVSHKRIESTPDFSVTAAYPKGQIVDMCFGKPAERPAADRRIETLSPPGLDPVFGESGPVIDLWRAAEN